jgi:uncharacterized protein involved in type VI secretion and phage assembly
MSLSGTLRHRHAGQAATDAAPRYGTIQSVNPANHTARVTIQPEGALSGWLPIHAVWIGNGWGMVCLPSPGDQVTLDADSGDSTNLKITGRVYNAGQTPPASNPGEMVLVHQSGSYLKLLNDGGIHSKGTWNHIGAISATGNITAGQGTGDQADLLNHTHAYIPGTSGSAQTQPPTAGT